jgi:hypothetical protein
MEYLGRRVTTFQLARLEDGQSIETGLLNIVSMGDGEYEILDHEDEELWWGDAESTAGYANGFNDFTKVAIKKLIPVIDNLNAGE